MNKQLFIICTCNSDYMHQTSFAHLASKLNTDTYKSPTDMSVASPCVAVNRGTWIELAAQLTLASLDKWT